MSPQSHAIHVQGALAFVLKFVERWIWVFAFFSHLKQSERPSPEATDQKLIIGGASTRPRTEHARYGARSRREYGPMGSVMPELPHARFELPEHRSFLKLTESKAPTATSSKSLFLRDLPNGTCHRQEVVHQFLLMREQRLVYVHFRKII
jgi:hypothetical protein